jgi:hypothetical protein
MSRGQSIEDWTNSPAVAEKEASESIPHRGDSTCTAFFGARQTN